MLVRFPEVAPTTVGMLSDDGLRDVVEACEDLLRVLRAEQSGRES
jgi:hypothetical protein